MTPTANGHESNGQSHRLEVCAPLDSRQALAKLILAVLAAGEAASVDVRIGGRHVRLDVRQDEAEPPPPAATPGPSRAGWQLFSDEEARVVEALAGLGWVSTAELALKLGMGQGATTELRVMVRNLGRRGVLEVSQRNGIRLNEGGAAPSPPRQPRPATPAPAAPVATAPERDTPEDCADDVLVLLEGQRQSMTVEQLAEAFASMPGTFRAWSAATLGVACRRLLRSGEVVEAAGGGVRLIEKDNDDV